MSKSIGNDATPAPGDRRARQRARRRAELYDAAMSLFVEHGYEGTTMEQIADHADVARATVFNHFPRKIGFLQEWATRRRAQALDAAQRTADHVFSIRTALAAYFTVMGGLADQNRPESVAVILGSVHATDIWRRSPVAADFTLLFGRAKNGGELRGTANIDRSGLLLAAAYYAILTAWATEEPAPFDLTSELLGTVDLLLDGVLPHPAQASTGN